MINGIPQNALASLLKLANTGATSAASTTTAAGSTTALIPEGRSLATLISSQMASQGDASASNPNASGNATTPKPQFELTLQLQKDNRTIRLLSDQIPPANSQLLLSNINGKVTITAITSSQQELLRAALRQVLPQQQHIATTLNSLANQVNIPVSTLNSQQIKLIQNILGKVLTPANLSPDTVKAAILNSGVLMESHSGRADTTVGADLKYQLLQLAASLSKPSTASTSNTNNPANANANTGSLPTSPSSSVSQNSPPVAATASSPQVTAGNTTNTLPDNHPAAGSRQVTGQTKAPATHSPTTTNLDAGRAILTTSSRPHTPAGQAQPPQNVGASSTLAQSVTPSPTGNTQQAPAAAPIESKTSDNAPVTQPAPSHDAKPAPTTSPSGWNSLLDSQQSASIKPEQTAIPIPIIGNNMINAYRNIEGRTNKPPGRIDTLLKQVIGALSRIQLSQIDSLLSATPESASSAGSQASSAPQTLLNMELPFLYDNKLQTIKLQIREDNSGASKEAADPMLRRWQLRLDFDLHARGWMYAEATLLGNEVSTRLWFTESSTLSDTREELQVLRQSLGEAGVSVVSIECQLGTPPNTDTHIKHQLVDTHS